MNIYNMAEIIRIGLRFGIEKLNKESKKVFTRWRNGAKEDAEFVKGDVLPTGDELQNL